MAPLFADTMDDYSVATERWDIVYGSVAYSSAYCPFPAAPGLTQQGMKVNSQSGGKVKNLGTNYNRLIYGQWWYFPTLPPATEGLVAFSDTGYSHLQVVVAITNAGAIQVWGGGSWTAGGALNTLLGTTAPGVVAPGWHFIEIDATFETSATGAVSVWLDAIQGASPVLALSSVVTAYTANSWANQLNIGDLGYIGNTWQPYAKDVYLLDNTGSAPTNAQMGMCRGYTKVPKAAGDDTNWTPNGASANWQCTDNEPPNDSIYVSAASNIEDTYTMQTAGITANPLLVMGRVRAWYDDAGPHTLQLIARSSGHDSASPAVNLTASPAWYDAFFADDPNTSAAWTAAAADAAQGGQNRAS